MKGERIRYQQTGEFDFLTPMAVPESVYLAEAKEAAEKGS
jgi:hypothetical protein